MSCGDSEPTPTDVSVNDLGPVPIVDTTGSIGTDTSVSDIVTPPDTQVPPKDGGEQPEDSSEPSQWLLTQACDDTSELVYQTPASALDPDVPLGSVVRCTKDPTIDAASVKAEASPLGISTAQGVEVIRIAYRTQRGEYGPGVGTARIFLPSPRPETPSPIIMLAHGTRGLADSCAPSKELGAIPEMALPFAGNDIIVVAPDYAGLGNEGVQGYRDNRDTTYSALDAVRAARELLQPEQIKDGYYAVGHSQGGGVVLYSQALSASYMPEISFKGGVAFAPGWTSSAEPNSQLYAAPQFVPVTVAGGAQAAIMSLFLYADASNHVDPEQPGIFFHPSYRAEIVEQIESTCVFGLASYFAGLTGKTLKDILDPVYLAVSLSCIQGDPACSSPYDGHIERSKNQYLKPAAEGPPILMVLGMEDKLATPSKAGCNLTAMNQAGFTPQVCVNLTAGHMNVVPIELPFAAKWIRAIEEGSGLPDCEWKEEVLPPCTDP